jgi:hypothetical protein
MLEHLIEPANVSKGTGKCCTLLGSLTLAFTCEVGITLLGSLKLYMFTA